MILLQVSVYPLDRENIDEHLKKFWKKLDEKRIQYKINPLSTVAWSENEDELYAAVLEAYRKVREGCAAAMVTTLTTGSKKEIEKLLSFK